MEYREIGKTGCKVSPLGFGMMRLPLKEGGQAGNATNIEEVDVEKTIEMVHYAIDHGINYIDTAFNYVGGNSEKIVGQALAGGYRDKVYLATKSPTWMYKTENDFDSLLAKQLERLQTDHIDYMLLHGIGMGDDGMEEFENRYMKNGILDFLLNERKEGRIRNLGFSYHGDIKVFDYLLSRHDEYKWDFAQIQLNYLDWKHAKATNERNTDAEYLYHELEKRNIPAVIMEPLLGGRLAKVPDYAVADMKQRDPDRSVASWAFRFAGSFPGVHTVLSGMTEMEHLKDNLRSLAPLKPLTDDDFAFLERLATKMVAMDTIPCNDCKYCMPCPYGIDIPSILQHYNKCVNDDHLPQDVGDPDYREARRAFLVGYDRSVPKLRQASHCIGCGQCAPHCPQRIDIPAELHRIDRYVEQLKQNFPKKA